MKNILKIKKRKLKMNNEELDIRIVFDDNATIIGNAAFSMNGDVTLTDPAFLIPDESGAVHFIPALQAMGVAQHETEIFITKDKLKFGKSFEADPRIANQYKMQFGYAVLELPEEKKLIL